MGLVAGVRWATARQGRRERAYSRIRARLRTPHRTAQRGPAAQCLFRQTLLRVPRIALAPYVAAPERVGGDGADERRDAEPARDGALRQRPDQGEHGGRG